MFLIMSDAITQAGYPDVVVEAVLARLLAKQRSQPWLIGVSGLQGSGKSTFCAQLVRAGREKNISVLSMSIDDFYFGRAERQRLARTIHPLLATRGVPGTHDVNLLTRTLDALRRATSSKPARIPRFDKGSDTRLPPSRWWKISRRPNLVVLEGWCVGVPPQTSAALKRPINDLERSEDSDGRWRTWVNEQLAHKYVPLWQRLDRLILLQAPEYAVVPRWRDEQERALRSRNALHAMSSTALRRFLMHYERLSRQALKKIPARADIRIVLDSHRHVRRIVLRS
jgi:D-glycerate 3-kinase